MPNLVLTRRLGETVVVGEVVRVTVAWIGLNKVSLAFEAPLEMAVDRLEIHERKQREGPHAPR